jgi:hypothetical protein
VCSINPLSHHGTTAPRHHGSVIMVILIIMVVMVLLVIMVLLIIMFFIIMVFIAIMVIITAIQELLKIKVEVSVAKN